MGAERYPEYHEEPPPDGEAQATAEMVDLARHFLEPDAQGRFRRGQHARDTGCVRAEFVVNPDVLPEARFGLFAEPTTYQAIVRFSNANATPQPDSRPDARGMAIKLQDVPGDRFTLAGEPDDRTQDFLMANHPVFIFPDAESYVRLFRRRRQGGLPLAFLTQILARPWRAWVGGKILRKPIASPLAMSYFSMSPYRLGPRAIKFSAQPRPENAAIPASSDPATSDTFLFDRLADQLSHQGASFDFLVQFQEDPATMPVEDPTVEWTSPFHPVATVRIPRQDLRSPEGTAFRESCEPLSFNPWHALHAHEPLGGINRLRRAVYQATSTLRVERNQENGRA